MFSILAVANSTVKVFLAKFLSQATIFFYLDQVYVSSFFIFSFLCLFCYICPSPISGPSEAESFQLEMSGLLSELACPYSGLTSGDITQRLLNRKDCLLLLSMVTSLSNLSVFLMQTRITAKT